MLEGSFAQKLCDASAWFEHSRSLIAMARISKEKSDILINHSEKIALKNVCSLLYGLSLENLFKAVWIYREYGAPNSPEWMPDSKFPSKIKTHNLVDLAKLIEPDLVSEYELSLQILTEAAIWSGRYPCSIRPSFDSMGGVYFDDIYGDAEKIYKKYKDMFTISS